MSDNEDEFEARLRVFTTGALAALTAERRAECELLADLQPGMSIRRSEMYPDQCELWWAGRMIGITTWSWLNTGASPVPGGAQ